MFNQLFIDNRYVEGSSTPIARRDAEGNTYQRPSLDDGSTQLEVTVFNELWDAERAKIKEDELLLVEGKVQEDRFSGGLRINAEKLYTLAEARGPAGEQLLPGSRAGTG